MIDFHNHVLSNVDDGPKSLDESIDMLKTAAKQGITDINNTVHFQHPKMQNKNVEYEYLKSKVNELQVILDKENIKITIHLSAEVFYLPNLLEISTNPLTTIGNGKYMLIEFKTNIFPTDFENQFYELQSNGITPIIAHPERYRFVQKEVKILKTWLERDYVIQIDAGSILGQFGKNTQNVALKMIKNGFIHLIGSDAHNNKNRNFCIKEAYEQLGKYDKKVVKKLKNNTLNILKGRKIEKIDIENKRINMTSKLFKLFG